MVRRVESPVTLAFIVAPLVGPPILSAGGIANLTVMAVTCNTKAQQPSKGSDEPMSEVKTSELSREALTALMNAGTNRIGARVFAAPSVMAELREAGLIANRVGKVQTSGLTRAGSIARERQSDRLMDELFSLDS
jgi:hypothetical protein